LSYFSFIEVKRKEVSTSAYHDNPITAASWLPILKSSSTTFFPFFPFFGNFFSGTKPPNTAVGSRGSRTSRFQISIAGYRIVGGLMVIR
jgi:hypothetical protein